ncbi:2'-5' RNA ligase family protein [Modestobacter sp. NPDC049651]|uniref:2'-5' RNA ligase family protein n=1 Tax=unclassified Modestobacter TaxID=2643866 RepID=UPI0033F53628
MVEGIPRRRVAGVLRGVPPFGYRFAGTGWFGDDVLWLAPGDPAPFRALSDRLQAEFPEHPPFEGAFGDVVVPHLTVGHRHPPAVLAAAEREVRTGLPVSGTAAEVVLLTEDEVGGAWSPRAVFPLGG